VSTPATTTEPADPVDSADVGDAADVGATDLGRIDLADRVVEKIAARAVREVPEAGASAPRVLGRTVPGAGHLGIRGTDLDAAPKVSADVDGTVVYVHLSLSVSWPASVATVTRAVRERVSTRVSELTGLRVAEVHIAVTDLVASESRRADLR
jgi:uncharacterized alkaline shock family protein YloU